VIWKFKSRFLLLTVVRAMVSVTTTPADAEFLAGQSVTVGAQLVIVWIEVAKTVRVVDAASERVAFAVGTPELAREVTVTFDLIDVDEEREVARVGAPVAGKLSTEQLYKLGMLTGNHTSLVIRNGIYMGNSCGDQNHRSHHLVGVGSGHITSIGPDETSQAESEGEKMSAFHTDDGVNAL